MRIIISFAFAAAVCGAMIPAAQAQRFNGTRVELNAGYDALHSSDGVAETRDTLDGVRVGGVLGFDLELGRTLVLGMEAGLGYNVAGKLEERAEGATLRLTSGRDTDLLLRVGARITPRTLLFAKGGYANSAFRARITEGSAVTRASNDDDGYRIGAGVEHLLTGHVFAKAEYRFTNYGDSLTRHQALAGLGYRF